MKKWACCNFFIMNEKLVMQPIIKKQRRDTK